MTHELPVTAQIEEAVRIAVDNPFSLHQVQRAWNWVVHDPALAEEDRTRLLGEIEPARQAAESMFILTTLARLGQGDAMDDYVSTLTEADESNPVADFYYSDDAIMFRGFPYRNPIESLSITDERLVVENLREDAAEAVSAGWVTTAAYEEWLEQYFTTPTAETTPTLPTIEEARAAWLATGPHALQDILSLPEEELTAMETRYYEQSRDLLDGVPFRTPDGEEPAIPYDRSFQAQALDGLRKLLAELRPDLNGLEELRTKDDIYAAVMKSDAPASLDTIRAMADAVRARYEEIVEIMAANDVLDIFTESSQWAQLYWDTPDFDYFVEACHAFKSKSA